MFGWVGDALVRASPARTPHPSVRKGGDGLLGSLGEASLSRPTSHNLFPLLTKRRREKSLPDGSSPPPLDREEEIKPFAAAVVTISLETLTRRVLCVCVRVCVCVLKHVFARQALPLGVQLSFASSSRSGRVVRNSFVHSPTPPVPHDARPADPYRRLLCVNPGHDRV